MFETLLAREHRVQALEPHLERLRTAVGKLYGQHVPDTLAERVRSTAANLCEPHRVRIDAIPDSGGVALDGRRHRRPHSSAREQPVTLEAGGRARRDRASTSGATAG